jgi:hypothetical protein
MTSEISKKLSKNLEKAIRSLIEYFLITEDYQMVDDIRAVLETILKNERTREYPAHILVAVAGVKSALDAFNPAFGGDKEKFKTKAIEEAAEWLAYYVFWPKSFWKCQKHLIDAAAEELKKSLAYIFTPLPGAP